MITTTFSHWWGWIFPSWAASKQPLVVAIWSQISTWVNHPEGGGETGDHQCCQVLSAELNSKNTEDYDALFEKSDQSKLYFADKIFACKWLIPMFMAIRFNFGSLWFGWMVVWTASDVRSKETCSKVWEAEEKFIDDVLDNCGAIVWPTNILSLTRGVYTNLLLI